MMPFAMKRYAVLVLPLVLLVACKQKESASPSAMNASGAPAQSVQAKVGPAIAAAARKVKEENPLFSLDYAYPAAAASIPGLKAKLDSHIVALRAELDKETKEEKAQSDADFEFRPHSRSLDWQIVAELPHWLSLSALASTYTGGAHPGYWFEAILWDKQANVERKPLDLFASKQALSAVIRKPFCDAIDSQRAHKRGEPVKRSSDEMFSECLDPTDYTVIFGSSDHKAFNRIGILVPPYEAGPYAEGEYEVTLPVTAEVMAQIKPEFRASFAVKR